MEVQGTDTTKQAEGEAPEANQTSTAQPVDVEAITAESAALKAKLEEVLADNAKYREERRKAKEADEASKLKAGEYEPLLKERESTIAELQAKVAELEPLAQEHVNWIKAEEKAISAAAAELDDEAKELLASTPLAKRRALLARLSGVQPKERPPEHPAGNPSPPSLSPGHIEPGISQKDPATWRKIKEGLGIKPSGGRKPHFA